MKSREEHEADLAADNAEYAKKNELPEDSPYIGFHGLVSGAKYLGFADEAVGLIEQLLQHYPRRMATVEAEITLRGSQQQSGDDDDGNGITVVISYGESDVRVTVELETFEAFHDWCQYIAIERGIQRNRFWDYEADETE